MNIIKKVTPYDLLYYDFVGGDGVGWGCDPLGLMSYAFLYTTMSRN